MGRDAQRAALAGLRAPNFLRRPSGGRCRRRTARLGNQLIVPVERQRTVRVANTLHSASCRRRWSASKETRRQLRGTQYRLVTRHAGLRAQHIHRLRACGARQALQWKRNRLPRGKCLRAPDPCPAPACRSPPCACAAKQCVGRGRLHAQHHFRLRHAAGAGRLRTGLQIRGIVHAAGPVGPGSTHTAAPGAASVLTGSGVAATRRASGPFLQHHHLHSHALLRSCAQSRRCQAERDAPAGGTGTTPA